jgi:hypothetical protein
MEPFATLGSPVQYEGCGVDHTKSPIGVTSAWHPRCRGNTESNVVNKAPSQRE